jgi:hypothetical protein
MKPGKRDGRMVALLLALMLFSTGCIGPNNTTKRLLTWNKSIDSKWGEECVFFVIFPAYLVTSLGDILIFNSIQFWSGKNPVDPPQGDSSPVTG